MKILSILLAVIISFTAVPNEHVYQKTGIVIEVNYYEDYIAVIDENSDVWEWSGAEDWFVNDIAVMTMFDNNTETIYDDIILAIRYDGWI